MLSSRYLPALLRGDRGGVVLLGSLALSALVLPLLALVVPASSMFHLSPFGLTLIGKYLCYAMTKSRGLTSRSVRRTMNPRSKGK